MSDEIPGGAAPCGQERIGRHESLEAFIEDFPLRPPVLLMAENDPAVIDVDYWIDLFQRTAADGATLAAGGYVAYYPTRIPYHHRSDFLGGRDLFGELVERCRGIGMKLIIARTDAHVVHRDARDAHPEWVAENARGEKIPHPGRPGAWMACPHGPYGYGFMNDVHKEIVSTYDVEFIFCNRWRGSAVCHCPVCTRECREATGDAPPANPRDRSDPAVSRYWEWAEERSLRLARFWNAEIRSVKPGGRFIANSGGGALSDLSMVKLAEMSPFLIADRQSRPGDGCHWANGKNAKEFRAVMGRKPVLAGVNVGLCGDKYRWMDSAKEPAELRMWHAEAVAHGMVPRYTKHSGVVYNRTWEQPVVEFFSWLKTIEPYLRNIEPVADVAMLYSQRTGRFYGLGQAAAKVEAPILGMYQAMVESRIPFEMAHDELLDPGRLGQFNTLVLPNIAALSDAQCAQIDDFVRRGGNLVATFETSLYDERGRCRSDFGLADLFGVSAAGEPQGPMRNSYLNVDPDPDGRFHPLVRGLEEHGRIVNGAWRMPIRPVAEFPSRPLTLVPSYPDLPMEDLYPRQPRTDIPELYIRQIGQSRIVYFPWDIDRLFWEILHAPHLALLRNAIEWANGGDQPVRVEGPGVVDIAVWRQKRSMTVNLVNLTNPMMMRGPYREITPAGAQRVSLRLPPRARVEGVKLLRRGIPAEYSIEQGRLELIVPEIADIEIVAVDLAAC